MAQLTDGKSTAEYFWTQKGTVGWQHVQYATVTVDLGQIEECAAFRIQAGGYPWWDALKGEVQDKVEVSTSVDGEQVASQGLFDFRVRW